MKPTLLLVCVAALFTSCSSPKFASRPGQDNEQLTAFATEPSVPLPLDESTLVASVSDEAFYPAPTPTIVPVPLTASKPLTLTREERKEVRKEAVKQLKAYAKAVKEGDKALATELKQGMDNDLKMAAIFGAVGIVSLIIGGDVFYVIGAVALIVGVVFFVKWLMRQ
jgi:hypothetical protein